MIDSTRCITPSDSEWPESLSEIADPPLRLYARGRPLPEDPAIAIVGTRRPTAAGIHAARVFASDLTDAGFVIVSGMAVGIDTIAHQAALENGGSTIAVLGCGLDVPYPKQNAVLRKRILEAGTLLSEYPDGTVPQRAYFPERNRIIAAISRGVVVVEGGETSGALITARRGLDYDKEIFAVPGSIRNPMAKASNDLIRTSQAKLVTDAKHVTDELAPGVVWTHHGPTPGAAVLDDDERSILLFLDDVPAAIDSICKALDMPFGRAAMALSRLEVRGLVRRSLLGYALAEGGLRVRAAF